jgi:RNA polymerase sigma-70 factor (ECF subfamily)
VLASLIGFLGDFDLAEEAAQEAFVVAAERWPIDGTPDNPGAWLITTARNRAIDRIRRDRTLAEKTRHLDVPESVEDSVDETTFPDERLELVFTCCHPALAMDAQVALTLRALGGLTTDEIARAFLVSEATMGAAAGARQAQDQGRRDPVSRPARSPPPRSGRRRARRGLSDLQRGLRRPRRPVGGGDPARACARRADARRARGVWPARCDAPKRLPARREQQDWPQIAALYGELARLTGSPVVELNRAVAVAEAGDVEAALALVDRLELDSYHYLHATRAELLRRLRRVGDARTAYERALELVHSDAERHFLERRLEDL